MTMKKNSNRRALGDIGNLIGAFSTKCVISNQAAGAENHVVGGKKSIIVANRPVTRKSVATLAKNQHLPQVAPIAEEHVQCGAKKRKKMGSKREKPNIKPDVQKSMEDCRVLDSMSSPSLLEIDENESMLVDSIIENKEDIDESSEMEIDEARDTVPSIDPMPPMPNIDEGDEGNPLAVAKYMQDMSRFYREREGLSCVPENYMSHQTKINQNIEVHWKLRLVHETLFLTINVMDRYLSSQRNLTRIELQVVGINSMLVASKYEETNGPRGGMPVLGHPTWLPPPPAT